VCERVRDKARSEESRSGNIVLIGVRASCEFSDEQHIRQIFKYMGKAHQNIVSFRRLGKTEFAPILCKLPDSGHRNLILAAARQLKGTEYAKVFVRPGMTAEEREDDRKLRQERDTRNTRSKESEGRQREWWRIRDGKLVLCTYNAARAPQPFRSCDSFISNGNRLLNGQQSASSSTQ